MFRNMLGIMNHTKAIHTGIQCNICGAWYGTYKVLNKHLRAKHNGGFKCEICKAWCRTQKAFNRHNRKVHTEHKRVLCRSCRILFPNKNAFKRHIKKKHSLHQNLRMDENGSSSVIIIKSEPNDAPCFSRVKAELNYETFIKQEPKIEPNNCY